MAKKQVIDLEAIAAFIPNVFDQAQLSAANHRKNCVALYKLHSQAATVIQTVKNGAAVKLTGERLFNNTFINMVNRILVIKKGSPPADRIVRFIGSYVKLVTDKGSERKTKRGDIPSSTASLPSDVDAEETHNTRFISRLLTYLLQGFNAKDKTVRYRAVSIIAELISHLGELDEEMYEALRTNLMERARDKESLIRAHALVALSKLLSGEDPAELEDGEDSILDVIVDSLCYDPAADVRRVVLLNTPFTKETLSALLSRTRDIDPSVRAYLFAVVLLPEPEMSASVARAANRETARSPNRLVHPRVLSIAQREQIVRDGLGDREDKVRAAAGKMLGKWFDRICEDVKARVDDEGDSENVIHGLVTFLQLFDVANEQGAPVATDALGSIFVTRPHVLDAIAFQETYWQKLTPESALLARVYIDQLTATENNARLESASLPVVTAFAFYVQECCNAIFDAMEALEEAADGNDSSESEEIENLEAQLIERVYILREILHIAVKLDYTDEIGRRKMFQVVRDMLAHDLLPERLIEFCLDVLKETTPNERDMIRIVVEIVNELRDSLNEDDDGNQSRLINESIDQMSSDVMAQNRMIHQNRRAQEMSPEDKAKMDEIDARCLAICIETLKRVNGSFDENSTLEGILADLIIPAVKRRDSVMRERGLVALGLCCLIAKNMAMGSFQLFLNQVHNAPEALKVKVLQVIFDILMVYDEEFLRRSEEVADRIITFLLQTLEVEESQAVQALLCIGISKLMLNGLITDERVLTISYLPMYLLLQHRIKNCDINQSRMQSVFPVAFNLVSQAYKDLEEDQEMITPLQFGILFIDWTNPQKAANREVTGLPERDVHVDLAIDILKLLCDSKRGDDDRKTFCQILSKLYLPDKPNQLSLLLLHILLEYLNDHNPSEDAASNKLLDRFRSLFKKRFSKQVDHIDWGKYSSAPELKEVCELVDIEIPQATEEGQEPDDDERSDQSDDREEEGEEEDRGAGRPAPAIPNHNAVVPSERVRRSMVPELSSDEDEDDGEGEIAMSRTPSPTPQRQKGKGKAQRYEPIVPSQRRNRISLSPSISSNDENELSPLPRQSSATTPQRKVSAKRFRSPGTPVSPVHKKRNQQRSPRYARVDNNGDPFVDATNHKSTNKKQSRSLIRIGPSQSSSDSEDEAEEVEGDSFEDAEESDADIPEPTCSSCEVYHDNRPATETGSMSMCIKPDRMSMSESFAADVVSIYAFNYTQLCAELICFYDILITFDVEVDRIWRRPFSVMKLLFLLNRYHRLSRLIIDSVLTYGIMSDSVSTVNRSSPELSPLKRRDFSRCFLNVILAGIVDIIGYTITAVFSALRILAIWGNARSAHIVACFILAIGLTTPCFNIVIDHICLA
ncbi:CND3 (condensin subunit 3) family protein [Abortiporus biennis]